MEEQRVKPEVCTVNQEVIFLGSKGRIFRKNQEVIGVEIFRRIRQYEGQNFLFIFIYFQNSDTNVLIISEKKKQRQGKNKNKAKN